MLEACGQQSEQHRLFLDGLTSAVAVPTCPYMSKVTRRHDRAEGEEGEEMRARTEFIKGTVHRITAGGGS